MLQLHRLDSLPPDDDNSIRLKIRRSEVFKDTVYELRKGLDVNSKRLRVVFLGESAVDAGGPMREYLHLLVAAFAQNNSLFGGPLSSRSLKHSVLELERQTFFYIGRIIALSLVYGGPAPSFFTPAVADYIVYGVLKVKATVDDVPDEEIKQKLVMVI